MRPRNGETGGDCGAESEASRRHRGAIAILTDNGGRFCRAKGFEHRSKQIGWSILAHNIHWIAESNARKNPILGTDFGYYTSPRH